MAPAGGEGIIGELLPGEDSSVSDPVELQHWISLYEERREIFRRRLDRADDPTAHARIQDYLDWANQRIAFWRNRHAQLAGILLDPQTRTMTGRAGRVSLTRREYELLSYLADHPGRHVPASLLVGRAWPDSDLCEEQLRTYVARLRRKMAEAGTPCRLVADRPRGYVLLFDEDVTAETGASIAS
jgi:DNA-binding response OmpR family regulator